MYDSRPDLCYAKIAKVVTSLVNTKLTKVKLSSSHNIKISIYTQFINT
jgi:hypothetical protein